MLTGQLMPCPLLLLLLLLLQVSAADQAAAVLPGQCGTLRVPGGGAGAAAARR
jgi:hypothetical protein